MYVTYLLMSDTYSEVQLELWNIRKIQMCTYRLCNSDKDSEAQLQLMDLIIKIRSLWSFLTLKTHAHMYMYMDLMCCANVRLTLPLSIHRTFNSPNVGRCKSFCVQERPGCRIVLLQMREAP